MMEKQNPPSSSHPGERKGHSRHSALLRGIIRPVLVAATLLSATSGWGAGEPWRIEGTRHNLSESGPGPIKSDDPESEVCIFCHIPHQARMEASFLWSRRDSEAEYAPYESSTLLAGEPVEGSTKRRVGQPTGASRLCLSCHDGTIALGAVLSRETPLSFPVGIEFLTEGRLTSGPGHLGIDLTDDHPISFVYDEALAAGHGGLVAPGSLPPEVRLDSNKELQCTSCHDPHDDSNGKFLVMDNSHAALCTSCHAPIGWDTASHKLSEAVWNQEGDDPWPHTEFDTVAKNACANCHRPHAAPGRERLLNYASLTANCVICHNGNVAQKNIVPEFAKDYGHFVQLYEDPEHPEHGTHDPAEDFSGPVDPHVACASCHNPHRTRAAAATAPDVPGALEGVSGISILGSPVPEAAYQYEICFKCHSGGNQFEQGGYTIVRQDPEPDTRLAFDTANASWHPVTGSQRFTSASVPSLRTDVPSLGAPYADGGYTLYCTDCHNNNNSSGPGGPHGSSHRYLLALNYTTGDGTPESAYEYALCYACHDRTSILDTGDPSGFPHKTHVSDYQAPCSACHDPHGSADKTHLINFDLGIVSPFDPEGVNRLEFVDTGTFEGTCYLVCHSESHDGTAQYSYPVP